ncbi:hypothetical protein LTR17_010753 [Elasticomyces elasticus]|nr:hypothetical protein LTR17_010753 [Elasticomyces elasticus]
MEHAQSECGLLSLPREIRDFIWENTIEETLQHPPSKVKRRAVAQPAISQVSKLIREETLPVFLSVTAFDLDFRNGAAVKKAKDWILGLEESARHLRKVDFYHHVADGEGETYVVRLTLDPWALRKGDSFAEVMYNCTERLSEVISYEADNALYDKKTALLWHLQDELDAIIDDGNIRSMGRKEWLSVLFLVREYFDMTGELFAEFSEWKEPVLTDSDKCARTSHSFDGSAEQRLK